MNVAIEANQADAILESLIKPDNKITINLLLKQKTDNEATLSEFLASMTRNGKNVGWIQKEKSESKFMNEWNAVLSSQEINLIDVSSVVSKALAVKDEDELASFSQTRITIEMSQDCSKTNQSSVEKVCN